MIARARICAGILAVSLAGGLAAQQRSAYEELQTFSGVLNHVRLNYADSVSYFQLIHAAIDGMLRALDPHSHFFSRLEAERFDLIERGSPRILAARVAEVRWGLDAYDELVARSSPDVQAAIGYFPRLHELLAAP